VRFSAGMRPWAAVRPTIAFLFLLNGFDIAQLLAGCAGANGLRRVSTCRLLACAKCVPPNRLLGATLLVFKHSQIEIREKAWQWTTGPHILFLRAENSSVSSILRTFLAPIDIKSGSLQISSNMGCASWQPLNCCT
ncbi:MAG: hypothetical protein WBE69_04385, partial [Candidatus Binataceae bacterium]